MVLFDEQMEHNGDIITIFFGGAMVMAAVSVPPHNCINQSMTGLSQPPSLCCFNLVAIFATTVLSSDSGNNIPFA